MRVSKYARQSRILEIIHEQVISTQEELVQVLATEGMQVTQATVSRDIKELGIVKTAQGDGTLRFSSLSRGQDEDTDRLMRVFVEAVVSYELAMNILVVHTLAGMASATGAALDNMKLNGVAGTLAGDDTIFIACYSVPDAKRLHERLMQIHSRFENGRQGEEETDAEKA